MWVRMTLRCERWVFIAVHGPGSKIREQVRDEFWEELSICLNGFGQMRAYFCWEI